MPSSSVTSSPMKTGSRPANGASRHQRRDRGALVGAARAQLPRHARRQHARTGRSLRSAPPSPRAAPHRLRARRGNAARSRAPCAPAARQDAPRRCAAPAASQPAGGVGSAAPLERPAGRVADRPAMLAGDRVGRVAAAAPRPARPAGRSPPRAHRRAACAARAGRRPGRRHHHAVGRRRDIEQRAVEIQQQRRSRREGRARRSGRGSRSPRTS